MTALSLFVPLIATVFAFWFIGYEMEIPLWRIAVSGIFVGLTSEFVRATCGDLTDLKSV
jgi:hypothetical protein